MKKKKDYLQVNVGLITEIPQNYGQYSAGNSFYIVQYIVFKYILKKKPFK